jgi:hypothetical protein
MSRNAALQRPALLTRAAVIASGLLRLLPSDQADSAGISRPAASNTVKHRSQ